MYLVSVVVKSTIVVYLVLYAFFLSSNILITDMCCIYKACITFPVLVY